jgi:dTDP-4-amino-4,6-dideoxygalactose transaminase
MAGATPFFVDIDPVSYTLDPQRVEEAIGDFKANARIRALLPVHLLYGYPAAMGELMELAARHSLAVIEDCAQAHGATLQNRKVGTFGQMATFSFYPTKNLGALGDGGAIVTSDPLLAQQAASLREYGWRERYISHTPGVNSRLDELQAAILRIKLRALDAENQRRRRIAAIYDEGLSGLLLDLPQQHEAAAHVYHQYVIRCDRRDALREHLRAREIGTLIHYPVPVHLQPAYQSRYPVHRNRLPVTERIASEILSLPIHPFLSENQAARVCQEIRAWFHG